MLQAATEIIVTRGSAALTHRAVAGAAGVSLGSTTQYFASIDELRETALVDLAEEIDESLAELDAALTAENLAETLARESHEFLRDHRTVRADIALMSAGTTDPRLRALALQWTDRLIEILSAHLHTDTATAITLYLDGATVHAGLHDTPISEQSLRAVIQALIDADRQPAPVPVPAPAPATAPTQKKRLP
ncbi:MAG: TetR family transcriptional regulator [Actinobacteria bacterium]|nr:TetR family transcriptional regulator [Actinomycetota bacterium]